MAEVFEYPIKRVEKRLLSKNFRQSLIESFLSNEIIHTYDTILIPTEMLKEICLEELLPPCFFLFENNVNISDELLYSLKDGAEIRIVEG